MSTLKLTTLGRAQQMAGKLAKGGALADDDTNELLNVVLTLLSAVGELTGRVAQLEKQNREMLKLMGPKFIDGGK